MGKYITSIDWALLLKRANRGTENAPSNLDLLKLDFLLIFTDEPGLALFFILRLKIGF